jgi:hypothetical protein
VGLKACLHCTGIRGLVKLRREYVFGHPCRVLGLIVIKFLLRPHLHPSEGAFAEYPDLHLFSFHVLLDKGRSIKGKRLRERLAEFVLPLNDIHANARALLRGLYHDRQTQRDLIFRRPHHLVRWNLEARALEKGL